ncbi:alpha/beta-hydrolase family protein [Gordonia sp. VNQ95]|uniref:alpha/beta-hydrolase family protein n=1 Tax=Gordonia TaxID=2053 RepID=UPI0032B4E0AF
MRTSRAVEVPHACVPISAALGLIIALWPGSLPRSTGSSAAVVAGCVGIATIAARLSTCRRTADSSPRRRLIPAVATLAAASTVSANVAWQNTIRTDLGVASIGVTYWWMMLGTAVATFAISVWTSRRAVVIASLLTAVVAGSIAPPAQAEAATHTDHPPTDTDTAAAAITRQWVRSGGLDGAAVVIAVPTGSGWVDPQAIAEIQDRFGGSQIRPTGQLLPARRIPPGGRHTGVAILTLPYADASSWRVFLTDPDAAARSAIALLRHVLDARDRRPGGARLPRVYLYGQSLGALGADRARAWAERTHPGAVSATMLAGVPADSVDTGRSSSPRTIVANDSDPVTRWSVRSLWHRPTPPDGTRRVGRPVHRPPWLPVASFIQASADLLASLDGPVGTGHRYGREQIQAIGPRAAS